MIHVALAAKPADFDEKVRLPGLSALAELVGEPPLKKRPGPKRTPIAKRREEIPAKELPDFWTLALDDLMSAYHEVCAYCCIRIERTTGAASVDHMVAKSRQWDRVYEWDNYRLASSRMNSRKNIHEVLDPFDIENGWFHLELFGYQVIPNPSLRDPLRQQVIDTIVRLGLNDPGLRKARERYAKRYLEVGDSFKSLMEDCPFVAMELRRHGRLLAGDR